MTNATSPAPNPQSPKAASPVPELTAHVFVDMDGVLTTGFPEGTFDAPDPSPKDSSEPVSAWDDPASSLFYDLKPDERGITLLRSLLRHSYYFDSFSESPNLGFDVAVLTHLHDDTLLAKRHLAQKRLWLSNHLDSDVFCPIVACPIGMSKWERARRYVCASNPAPEAMVLIDDWSTNVIDWTEHGGLAILWDPSAKVTSAPGAGRQGLCVTSGLDLSVVDMICEYVSPKGGYHGR